MNSSLSKNAIYKMILNIFNLLVPLLVTPYLTNLLSPELYGMYNTELTVAQVFVMVGAFGIYNYGVRELSKARNDETKRNQVFTSLFLISILTNVIVTFVYLIFAFKQTSSVALYIYLVMALQIIANIFYVEFMNEAIENYKFITLKTIMIRTAYLASVFIFIRRPEDVFPYAIVTSLIVFFNNFASYAYLRKRIKFDFRNIQIIQHLLPLFITFLLTNVELLYSQLDKLMLSDVNKIWTTEYLLPYNLVAMIGAIPLSLISVAIPRLSAYCGEKDWKSYEKTLNQTIKSFMAILIPICFGIFVLSKEIMLIYMNQYSYAYAVLMVAAITRLAFGYQSIINNLILYINGMEKQMAILLAIFGVFNIGTNLVLKEIGLFLPNWTLFTNGLSCLCFNFVAYQYIKRKLPDLQYQLFPKRVIGYFIVAALFIPLGYGVKMFHFNTLITTGVTIMLCMLLYGTYMIATKDAMIAIIAKKLHIERLLYKLHIMR